MYETQGDGDQSIISHYYDNPPHHPRTSGYDVLNVVIRQYMI
ncbi:hypothetical protein [Paenibacillus riograndensis]|nr:hypothetical protein [Paenibacillus riograndensis]